MPFNQISIRREDDDWVEAQRREEERRYMRRRPYPYSQIRDYGYENQNTGLQAFQSGRFLCPVCGSTQCSWWYERIVGNTAGDVLKDMVQGVFRGDYAYDGRMDQEQYYQQSRERYYGRKQSPTYQPEIIDVDCEVSDVIKLQKMLQVAMEMLNKKVDQIK